MKKIALRLGAAALALAVTSSLATAGKNDSSGRKFNLFDNIFNSKKKTAKKPTTASKKRRNLLGDDWWNNDSDVRIISGQDTGSRRRNGNVILADDDDPEGDPGIGMGNLTYVADKTVPLGGLTFPSPRPEAAASGAVHDVLTSGTTSLRVVTEVRDVVAEHYAQRNFRPLWIEDGGLSERGAGVLKLLSDAGAEGLDAASYLPPSLDSFSAPPSMIDDAALARLDVELTALALDYARDASGGQFDPRRLSLYNDVAPERVPASRAIKVLGWSPFPVEYLQSLHPKHPAYAAMKAALAELRTSSASLAIDIIGEGPVVRRGMTDNRVEAVRQRLADLGFSQALEAAGDPQVFDADLSVQLRLFQKSAGIGADGLLGNQTITALNSDHSARDEARLVNNMERMRWLPKDLGTRHVFVNQPAFEVEVMDNGQEVWRSRVIVGRPMTQTAVFHDQIETVVFNPSWGVPQSIIANEYLPKLRRDPGYLDRIGFKVVNARGKVVSSSSVDWWSYGSKVPYGVQQPPGSDNALGEIKFLFPNSHNIYMHDTPTRHLFDKDVRAFSHGCVRVQNPREFASVLLGWDAGKVDANTDSGRSQSVKLETKVPVHLTYFTAWPDETGKIRYFNDIYGRDKTMDNARSAISVAQK